jgi:hypothetical protein
MSLDTGEKVFASLRRLFEGEYLRFFLGEITAVDGDVIALTGHALVWDPYAGAVLKREGERTMLLSVSAGTFLMFRLDPSLDLHALSVSTDTNGRLWLVDGERPLLELEERASISS